MSRGSFIARSRLPYITDGCIGGRTLRNVPPLRPVPALITVFFDLGTNGAAAIELEGLSRGRNG
jgi:hypothetical protein